MMLTAIAMAMTSSSAALSNAGRALTGRSLGMCSAAALHVRRPHDDVFDFSVRSIVAEAINGESRFASVVDLGCGVGMSTPSGAMGVDIDNRLVGMAKIQNRQASFVVGDARTFGKDGQFDVALLSFVLSTVPDASRSAILRNALRISSSVVVVDTSPRYAPGPLLLSNEPHLKSFLMHADVYMHKHVLVQTRYAAVWLLTAASAKMP